MSGYCLIPSLAKKLKQEMIDGNIDPEKMSLMTSAERHAVLAKIIGEDNAKNVNALFESKLLLKNQQQGMINWAKKVVGISKATRQDLISKIQRLDKALTPETEKTFLNDLIEKRLGLGIDYSEAEQIAGLYKKIGDAEKSMKNGGDRMEYGRAVVDLNNYFNDLKNQANHLSFADIKKHPIQALGKGVSELAGNAKAIKASMDNSAIFRQGWKAMWTQPTIWARNAVRSFSDIIQTFGKDQVMKELNADILSRPNAINGYYKKAKLAVGTVEEAYPTSIPERIPILGKFYKASENAFTAFVHRTRADVFDKYIQVAEKSGVELNDSELASIGKLVNSLTGRGDLGRVEPVANIVNNVFFSPRMLKSELDMLAQPFNGAGGSNFVRKQAAINLTKIILGTAAVLGTAKIIDKKSVDFDPRSSDFGKIKVGNTRFDVTGGSSSLAILAARLLTSSSKSSTTGKVSALNTGKFGSQTTLDVVYNFFENKLSPATSVVKDLLKGQTFQGTKPTIGNEAVNLFVPLPVTTGIELYQNPHSANIILSLIADGLGIATNTYGK